MSQPSNTTLSWWRRLIAPHPSIQDVGEKRRASLLAIMGIALFPLMVVATVSGFLFRQSQGVSQESTAAPLALTITFLLAYILARTKYYRVGSVILTMIFLASAVQLALIEPTSLTEIFYSVLPLMFIISIALFNRRGMWMLFGMTMLGMVVIALGKRDMEMRLLVQTIGITAAMGILSIIVVVFRDSIERERVNELQTANQELLTIRNELEQRIEERTSALNERTIDLERYARQMDAVSKVARVIASIQDLDRLLPTITQLVSDQFGFYHTGIFLLDEKNEYAVLQAANSEGGKNMLKRGHRLRLGTTGIVGYVTAQGEARIALDVGTDAVYFDNPDLPNTRSEMALPLKVAGQTIGALDVQSTETGAFKPEDISVLATLADQIAIAIENARLFSQTHRALDESRSVYEEYVKQEWARFARQIERVGYSYDGIKTAPLSSVPAQDDPQTLKVPVRIRGLIIGYVNLRSNDPLRQWTQDEINLIQAAAERAGLAIENVRLLAEAQRRAAKERTIGEITSKISASIEMNSIMQTAVEELGRALPGSEIILQFQEKE